MKLEELAGQKLVFGIPGPQLTQATVKLFRDTHAGGVIFFRRNFKTAAQFKLLIQDLEETLGRKLLVMIDHEGGRVIHLAEGVTVFPDNLCAGHTGKVEYAEAQGRIEALELRRLGIDLNLAPTLDVLTETFSPNIGIRSYGKDPELVARFGAARIRAMQACGLSACAKHCPGLGQASLDPHLGLPVLDSDWEEMRKVHLKPFLTAIEAGVDAIMTSHPVYPRLDPVKVPVTFSRRLVHDFLRKTLRFQGLILTDDLEMGALRNFGSVGHAAVRAAQAGHDLLLVCQNPKAQREACQALREAYFSEELSWLELEKSALRIENFKRKRPTRFSKGPVRPEAGGQELAEKIAREGVRINLMGSDPKNSNWGQTPQIKMAVIFPALSSLRHSIFIEKELLNERAFVRKLFKKVGAGFPAEGRVRPTLFGGKPALTISDIHVVSLSPTKTEVKKAVAAAKKSDLIFFFCYDAHLDPKTKALLDGIVEAGSPRPGLGRGDRAPTSPCVAVIFLRDPYDQEFLASNIPWAQAFGFRAVQIESAVQKLVEQMESFKVPYRHAVLR